MKHLVSRTLTMGWALGAAAALLVAGTPSSAHAQSNTPGAVYAMTNDATDNQVVVLNRAADGTLTQAGSFPTGGTGSGTFENSANGLILSEQSPNNIGGSFNYLFATNAGSNSISVFDVQPDGSLVLVEVEPSNGD
ncbi:MAG: lactonase family protein [Acidobacteriota bacterium]|nr:lactonase family protein [Acidobacteriota bacterium]